VCFAFFRLIGEIGILEFYLFVCFAFAARSSTRKRAVVQFIRVEVIRDLDRMRIQKPSEDISVWCRTQVGINLRRQSVVYSCVFC
jgi:hypothetical protein